MIVRYLSVVISVLLVLAPECKAQQLGPAHEASYWEKLTKNTVRCELCPRRCVIPEGKRGACRVRENRRGKLYALTYGNVCTIANDPIEKAPFYHFLPGTSRLGIATAGCNQSCQYCQNWQISQRRVEDLQNRYLLPDSVVALAQNLGLPTVCFTYSEPTVFYEYMCDIADRTREAGLRSVVVSSGYINEEPLRELCSKVDAIKIDLKGFSEDFYQKVCGSHLAPVLNSIKTVKESGIHLEIVNLVVPTLNDDTAEIRQMCRWLKENIGTDVPLHFSRFTPNYKLTGLPPTPVGTLEQAIAIARDEGLKYVYIGNVPGHKDNDTYCPKCRRRLIQRAGYDVLENNIKDGRCRFCGQEIPGVWR